MPEQPRVPAGDPKGGQWTSSGKGQTQGDNRALRAAWGEAVEDMNASHITDEKYNEVYPAAEPHPNPHKLIPTKEWPGGNRGLWGSSHGSSYGIAGSSAEQMGIDGYWTPNDESKSMYNKHASFMLRKISEDTVGTEEVLYHGTQNLKATHWAPGDTVRLPLTATAGNSDTITYGTRNSAADQKGAPTLFMFEKGTQMLAYQKWSKKGENGDESKEFGHNYTEAIVAGKFEVVSVKEAAYPFHEAWSEHGYPMVTVVKMRQVETYHPESGWRKK